MWEKSKAEEKQRQGMTYEELRTKDLELRNDGWGLTIVDGY